MVLTVVTDLEQTAWLQYVLEEFVRIERGQFSVRIVSAGEEPSGPALCYLRSADGHGCQVPNRSNVVPDGTVEYLDETTFVLPGTQVGKDAAFSCDYDLFWNVFIFLSRWEEYHHPQSIASYSLRHPRKDRQTFRQPVVNAYFQVLKSVIRTHCEGVAFAPEQAAVVELTHDLDYLKRTLQLRIKQGGFHAFNTVRNLHRPADAWRHLVKSIQFVTMGQDYWNFDYWLGMDQPANRPSVFYIYSHVAFRNFKAWLIDPSYRVGEHEALKDALLELREKGVMLGLHTSLYAATDSDLMAREKAVLEEVIHTPVVRNRNHWLTYHEQKTPYLFEQHFEVDSTIGWNDNMGFRAGIASVYRPFDHARQRPFDFMEVPQFIMDSHLYDYNRTDLNEAVAQAISLLRTVQAIPNAHAAISWHPRTCSADYGWHHSYEQILQQWL